MPAQRPRASFEPIPPDLDLHALVEETENFKFVDRITCGMIDEQGIALFDKLVLQRVIIEGKPLVIEGYHTRLDPWTFSSKWLQDNHGSNVEYARNITDQENIKLSLGHYLRNLSLLTNQYFDPSKPSNYKDKKRQRIYLKDIDCPPVWQAKLQDQLPKNLFYWNDNTGEIGGPGAVDEPAPTGGRKKGKGIAPAGDLMSSLPPPMRAVNLMCYIGHEGTYTPAHREMCASLGHNIMVEASDQLADDGTTEKPGSSIWFMTETKDRHMVAEYWLSILGHDIEVEKHFAQISAWKRAPFTTWVVEQRPGDFILIPPLAPHQVWNRGTRTMKVAWNRTTPETLRMAFDEALPNARMVCRDEQYKNKAIVFFTLQKYSSLLAKFRDQQQTAPSPQEAQLLRKSPKIKQLHKHFKTLFEIFQSIVLSEHFSPDIPHERSVQFNTFEGNITCAYCRGNIFNRFLTCSSCENSLQTPEAEPYDICMDCYVMGRSCGCISKLRWAEQFKWKELTAKYEHWRKQIIDIDGGVTETSPKTLQDLRTSLPTKTLAQICQEQLKVRPWVDINKTPDAPELSEDDEAEIRVNDDGTVRKNQKKRRSEAWLKNNKTCHVCCHRHEKWKMAECKCGRWWCFGTLFRAHDESPQSILENPKWECPHCRNVCTAGSCRKDPRQTPYEPKGTLLGHDTRAVADVRSVESLVDFRSSNLHYLRESIDAPEHNVRLIRKQEEAERARRTDVTMDQNDVSDDDEAERRVNDTQNRIEYSPDTSVIEQRRASTVPGSQWQAINTIDPSLQEDMADPAHYAPAPAGSLDNTRTTANDSGSHQEQESFHDGYQGYEPATHSGFVAPSAVMYRQPLQNAEEEEDHEEDNLYADVDELDEQPSTQSDRAHQVHDDIIRQPPKRRRLDEPSKPVSGATKQFRKEQEKQALEKARSSGRWFMTHAALKGKSKVVKLRISRQAMRRLAMPQPRGQTGNKPHEITNGSDGLLLLSSDIAPAPPPSVPVAQTSAQKNRVRVRVEKDDDFNTRKRKRLPKSSASKDQIATTMFEELEIDSLSEDEPNESTQADGGAVEVTDDGNRRRRVSAWQAARHEDEDSANELAALPDNWKDGRKKSTLEELQTSSSLTKSNLRPAAPEKSATPKSILKHSTTVPGVVGKVVTPKPNPNTIPKIPAENVQRATPTERRSVGRPRKIKPNFRSNPSRPQPSKAHAQNHSKSSKADTSSSSPSTSISPSDNEDDEENEDEDEEENEEEDEDEEEEDPDPAPVKAVFSSLTTKPTATNRTTTKSPTKSTSSQKRSPTKPSTQQRNKTTTTQPQSTVKGVANTRMVAEDVYQYSDGSSSSSSEAEVRPTRRSVRF